MDQIGGYRLERQLGSGGMGTVWRARDAEGKAVAFKLIHPHIAGDPENRVRLEREVRLLQQVTGPGVARVLDAEVDASEAFVVTELIEGPTLEQDVAAHGPFTPEELARLARGLADALGAIHRAGVVHRDLKPANVMLSTAGPVIIDFGIAQVVGDLRLTQVGMVTGTPGYLDPAVSDGADPTPASDWWAWAAVLVFAGTGRHPFGARGWAGAVDVAGMEPLAGAALQAALRPDAAARPAPEMVLAALEGRGGETAPLVGAGGWVGEPWAGAGGGETAPLVGAGGGVKEPWAGADSWVGEPWAGAGGGETAPRRRRVVVAAAGMAVGALGVVWPGVTLIGLGAILAVVGALGFGGAWLESVRLRRGRRSGDWARALLASPWHLLRGTLLAAYVLAVGAGLGYLAASLVAPESQFVSVDLVAGMAAVLLAAWWLPGARRIREGARALAGFVLPVRWVRVLFVLGCGVIVLGVVVGILAGALPNVVWYPLPVLSPL